MSFQDEGFLSDTLNHCFREMTECSEWFNLAFRLNRWAHRFALTEREFEVEGNGLADVKALTSMLFFRALSNFQGCIVLADRGLIVEARTLARSCGESALSMVGAKFDPDHWKALMDDEVKSRRSRARLLMGNSHWMTSEQYERLKGQVAAMTADWKRLSGLDYAKIAEKGGCQIHYVMYRQLSGDAAHASFESLLRYVTESDGTIESLQPAAKLTPAMISETIDIACNFLFLCGAVILEQFPDAHASKELDGCWQQYKVLTKTRRAGSDSA
jgi:hypothetical protein